MFSKVHVHKDTPFTPFSKSHVQFSHTAIVTVTKSFYQYGGLLIHETFEGERESTDTFLSTKKIKIVNMAISWSNALSKLGQKKR